MPERRVGVVDYQSGNVHSVLNALETAGARTALVRRPEDFAGCSHLLLPGVGAFGFCADSLRASGLVEALEDWALRAQRPLLGICVGMQLLADRSEELGEHAGLGWIGGEVRRLQPRPGPPPVRVPHVGWNEVRFAEAYGDFAAGEAADFYFDHSYAYHAPRLGHEVAGAEHGERFCAMVRRDNLVAVQFHPEKSQSAGLRLLSSFLAS
jgi:glutamine amidotransferase